MPTPFQFLHESGVTPLHRRGQNFLIDKNIVRKIMEAADVKKSHTVLEIGSGSGELTAELAVRAKKVFAVEIDAHLFEVLTERMKNVKNITLLKDDIRAIPNTAFGKKDGSYRVIANIPYHITSQIIRKFLERAPRPKDLVLLMQKEVARRITAQPPQMSLLAVSVQYYAEAKILFPVSRNSFFPKPHVDSAVVRLGLSSRAKRSGVEGSAFFFSIVRAGFSAKRKQCAQSISKKLRIPLADVLSAFQKASISQKARAQEISVSQWEKVADVLSSRTGSLGHPPADERE